MQGRQIIIADNQDIMRLGLTTLIHEVLAETAESEVKEVKQTADLVQSLKENPLSVVVIDTAFFQLTSDELQKLSKCFVPTMWILFCEYMSEPHIRQLSEDQHFSIVYKDNSAHEIATAIKYAISGVRFLCHQVTDVLLAYQPQQSILERDGLTATEIEILRLIAFGKSVKEIALERNSSTHTITTHKKNIFRKINVSTVYNATKYALRAGLIEYDEYV